MRPAIYYQPSDENIGLNADPASFVRVNTADGKWLELYWVGDKLTLRENADIDEAAQLFFDKVQAYGTALAGQSEPQCPHFEVHPDTDAAGCDCGAVWTAERGWCRS